MPADCNFSLSVQAIILFISILLFVIYYYRIFAYEKHNRLALAFAIVTLIWFITIVYRYICTRGDEVKQHIKHMNLFDVPYGIKCTVGDDNCEDGDATSWLIIHFTIYILIGLWQPGCYIEIIIISIICEMLESGVSHTSKFVVDPMINFLGYLIGSSFSRNNQITNLLRCQTLDLCSNECDPCTSIY